MEAQGLFDEYQLLQTKEAVQRTVGLLSIEMLSSISYFVKGPFLYEQLALRVHVILWGTDCKVVIYYEEDMKRTVQTGFTRQSKPYGPQSI